jgi:hypothetical protein
MQAASLSSLDCWLCLRNAVARSSGTVVATEEVDEEEKEEEKK